MVICNGGGTLQKYAMQNNIAALKNCLVKGLQPNAVNENGETALYVASYYGHEDIVDLLLCSGAKPNLANGQGNTALHAAASRGHHRIMLRLISSGADLSLVNYDGKRVADVARGHRAIDVVNQKWADFQRLINCGQLKPGREHWPQGVLQTGFGPVAIADGSPATLHGLPIVNAATDELRDDPALVRSYRCGAFTEMISMTWRSSAVSVRQLNASKATGAHVKCLALNQAVWEVTAACSLRHPAILTMMAVCVDTHTVHAYPVFTPIFERVGLGSLFHHLHVRYESLNNASRYAYLRQVCEALAFLHSRGVVHASVSSHAVHLVSPALAKLGCLEYSVSTADSGPRCSFASLNDCYRAVANWLAPELLNRLPVTPAADVYGLGAVAWEMWTEMVPHDTARSPADIRRRLSQRSSNWLNRWRDLRLPDSLQQLVLSAVLPEPHRRPSLDTVGRFLVYEYWAAQRQDDVNRHRELPRRRIMRRSAGEVLGAGAASAAAAAAEVSASLRDRRQQQRQKQQNRSSQDLTNVTSLATEILLASDTEDERQSEEEGDNEEEESGATAVAAEAAASPRQQRHRLSRREYLQFAAVPPPDRRSWSPAGPSVAPRSPGNSRCANYLHRRRRRRHHSCSSVGDGVAFKPAGHRTSFDPPLAARSSDSLDLIRAASSGGFAYQGGEDGDCDTWRRRQRRQSRHQHRRRSFSPRAASADGGGRPPLPPTARSARRSQPAAATGAEAAAAVAPASTQQQSRRFSVNRLIHQFERIADSGQFGASSASSAAGALDSTPVKAMPGDHPVPTTCRVVLPNSHSARRALNLDGSGGRPTAVDAELLSSPASTVTVSRHQRQPPTESVREQLNTAFIASSTSSTSSCSCCGQQRTAPAMLHPLENGLYRMVFLQPPTDDQHPLPHHHHHQGGEQRPQRHVAFLRQSPKSSSNNDGPTEPSAVSHGETRRSWRSVQQGQWVQQVQAVGQIWGNSPCVTTGSVQQQRHQTEAVPVPVHTVQQKGFFSSGSGSASLVQVERAEPQQSQQQQASNDGECWDSPVDQPRQQRADNDKHDEVPVPVHTFKRNGFFSSGSVRVEHVDQQQQQSGGNGGWDSPAKEEPQQRAVKEEVPVPAVQRKGFSSSGWGSGSVQVEHVDSEHQQQNGGGSENWDSPVEKQQTENDKHHEDVPIPLQTVRRKGFFSSGSGAGSVQVEHVDQQQSGGSGSWDSPAEKAQRRQGFGVSASAGQQQPVKRQGFGPAVGRSSASAGQGQEEEQQQRWRPVPVSHSADESVTGPKTQGFGSCRVRREETEEEETRDENSASQQVVEVPVQQGGFGFRQQREKRSGFGWNSRASEEVAEVVVHQAGDQDWESSDTQRPATENWDSAVPVTVYSQTATQVTTSVSHAGFGSAGAASSIPQAQLGFGNAAAASSIPQAQLGFGNAAAASSIPQAQLGFGSAGAASSILQAQLGFGNAAAASSIPQAQLGFGNAGTGSAITDLEDPVETGSVSDNQQQKQPHHRQLCSDWSELEASHLWSDCDLGAVADSPSPERRGLLASLTNRVSGLLRRSMGYSDSATADSWNGSPTSGCSGRVNHGMVHQHHQFD